MNIFNLLGFKATDLVVIDNQSFVTAPDLARKMGLDRSPFLGYMKSYPAYFGKPNSDVVLQKMSEFSQGPNAGYLLTEKETFLCVIHHPTSEFSIKFRDALFTKLMKTKSKLDMSFYVDQLSQKKEEISNLLDEVISICK